MFVLPFYSKSVRPLLKLFEFGLNLVMIIKRYIIFISDLLRTKSKTIGMAMQMAIKKFVSIHIEKLQFFFGISMALRRQVGVSPMQFTSKTF